MNPARWAQRHGRAVLLLAALVPAAGAIAYLSLPSGIYPELKFPRIVILATSGHVPARSMMLTVAQPLEQAVMEVPGVRRVRSQTFRGATEISAQFEPATDMVVALQQAQNRIAEARAGLPGEIDLTVERLTPAAFPILIFNLTGGLAIPVLRDYAFYVMRPAISRIPGVGRVEVLASDTREIEVVADPGRLLAAGLTVEDIGAALRSANTLKAVGRYATGGRQHLVLVSGLWAAAGDISQTLITVGGGAALRVADVATVFPGSPDRTLLIAGNGADAVSLGVSQQVGASILSLKKLVDETMEDLGRTLPSGLSISRVYDLAEFVSTAIANVRDAILIGGLLAVLVLVAFLRRWRLTLIASTTLPLTALSTFLFMKLAGESINIMSMGGLAVAIGLVIDDAVVVVENIHRRMAAGAGPRIVEEATAELVAPVVGSTLTTVVVLVPLGLLTGVVGQFFRSLSFTLSVAVLISLVLSLTLIPLLSRLAYHRHPGRPAPRAAQGRLASFYPRTLAIAMRHPRLAVGAAAGLGVLGGLLYFTIPTGFLPQIDEGGFVVDYLSPPGTALEQTDAMIRKVEKVISETPEVASYSRRTGSELGLFATQQNKGDVLVRLKPRNARDRSAQEIIDDLRPRLREVSPGLDIEFVQLLQDMIGDLEGNPTPIEVKIFGDDPETLEKVAGQVEPLMAGVRGVVDLVGVRRGNPEVTWEVDPLAAGRLGLTVEQISAQVSAASLGQVATDLRLLDRAVPVRVRYPDSERLDPSRLAQMPIRGAGGKMAPLSALARLSLSDGQSVLVRENLRQLALLTGRLEERDLGSAVAEIKARLEGLRLPVGYSIEVGGQYESQRAAFGELMMVLAVAAVLVFIILVFQFRAFTPALVILAAAPLSFAGSFLLLRVTGTELNVSSAMGLILLVGLVVKNGIVMLDYAFRLRAGGTRMQEAVYEAAKVRLRPILMTTLCTLFGLLPLALGLGAGAEIQKPLALAVIGGLGFSTLITLYAVPAVFAATTRWFGSDSPEGGSGEPGQPAEGL
jgi:CzcA family heavy metal efflux pump